MNSGTNLPLAGAEPFGPLLALVGAVVRSTVVGSDGSLRIVLTEDRYLFVPADVRFEAWDFCGADGSKVVCAPGGELYVWSPRPG